MEIIKVETKKQIEILKNYSAMTWEGLQEQNFEIALQTCSNDMKGYLIKGEIMNKFYKLTGNNAYPNDLNIFSIPNFKGRAINYGARWLDDIIENNARRQRTIRKTKKYDLYN